MTHSSLAAHEGTHWLLGDSITGGAGSDVVVVVVVVVSVLVVPSGDVPVVDVVVELLPLESVVPCASASVVHAKAPVHSPSSTLARAIPFDRRTS